MSARYQLIGTLAIGLVAASDAVHAQDSALQALPDVEVTAPVAGTKPARSGTGARTARVLRRVPVYPTAPTPTATVGIDVEKVPSAINAVGANQI
ncbi:MAG: hypothetical protein DI543_12565, partial [Bradyrhizobium icense]